MNEQLSQKELLSAVLLSYQVATYDFEEIKGTAVTLYKFRPKVGVRISRIRSIKDELASVLGVPSLRIIAPMQDGSVGIEVPNKVRDIVAHAQTHTRTVEVCAGRPEAGGVFHL